MASTSIELTLTLYRIKPETLKSFRNSRPITITWTIKGYARIIVLPNTVPRNAMIVFSGVARDRLLFKSPRSSNFHIEFGVPCAVNSIIAWINTCCQAGKIVDIQIPTPVTFMPAWHIYKVAVVYEMATLQEQILRRLRIICEDRVHHQTCREVFNSSDPEKMRFRDLVAKSTARALCDGRLICRTEISMLRAEGPFNEAVTKFLDPLIQARNERWAKEEAEEEAREWQLAHQEAMAVGPSGRIGMRRIWRRESLSRNWTSWMRMRSVRKWSDFD